jgi:hypothetical protein
MIQVSGFEELQQKIGREQKAFVMIYKSGSEQSDCAFHRMTSLEKKIQVPMVMVDVNRVKDIHPVYGISSAPSLLNLAMVPLSISIRVARPLIFTNRCWSERDLPGLAALMEKSLPGA